MTTSPAGPTRTLADELRARSDDELAALLAARPDLLTPVPADITHLVARANSRASVGWSLDSLDRFTLQVLDALVYASGPSDIPALVRLVPAGTDQVRAAVDRVRTRALAWGPDEAIRPLHTLREVLGEPAGTGPRLATLLGWAHGQRLEAVVADLHLPEAADPPAAVEQIAALFGDPDRFAELIRSAPGQARELLEVLAAGPPTGTVERADRRVRAATAASPVEWLLARGLLVATGPDTVVLPGEVAVAVRGGCLHPQPHPHPPVPDLDTAVDSEAADEVAAGQAAAAVRQVTQLLEAWAGEPPRSLRTGGLGVRDLRRTATRLDLDEHLSALIVETAAGAGLLAEHVDEAGLGTWLPTPAFDRWLTADTADQWADLARAWLGSDRPAALVGDRDVRDRPAAALGHDLDRPGTAQVRQGALAALASAPPGSVWPTDAVLAYLDWQRPRRGDRLRRALVPALLTEAAHLGLTGRGALAGFTRRLLDGPPEPRAGAAAAALARLLPSPVDHVLIQADLTAIAPGPLQREVATALGALAEVESTGAATVYRFTEASLRRGLDAGWTAAEIHELLRTRSRTPVPQPLDYLVDDLARRHGRIRIGVASAYLRCEDETALNELLAHPRAAEMGLRRLAPTVAVAASVEVETLLERLRALGHAPAAESESGTVLVRARAARRAAGRPRAEPSSAQVAEPALLAAAVRSLRAGERAASVGSAGATNPADAPGAAGAAGTGPGRSPAGAAGTLERLRQAAAARRSLWMGYVGDDGTVTERMVDPITVDAGRVIAFDHRLQKTRTFALARIAALIDA